MYIIWFCNHTKGNYGGPRLALSLRIGSAVNRVLLSRYYPFHSEISLIAHFAGCIFAEENITMYFLFSQLTHTASIAIPGQL